VFVELIVCLTTLTFSWESGKMGRYFWNNMLFKVYNVLGCCILYFDFSIFHSWLSFLQFGKFRDDCLDRYLIESDCRPIILQGIHHSHDLWKFLVDYVLESSRTPVSRTFLSCIYLRTVPTINQLDSQSCSSVYTSILRLTKY